MSRLIDGDAIMNTLQKLFDKREKEQMFTGSRESCVTWNDAIYCIKSAQTVDAEPKWIPCKERLPESYGKYIVTSCAHGEYVRMLNYGEADFAKKNPCWFYYDSEYGDVTVDNVIAWMPLPKPYKGKEQDDGQID